MSNIPIFFYRLTFILKFETNFLKLSHKKCSSIWKRIDQDLREDIILSTVCSEYTWLARINMTCFQFSISLKSSFVSNFYHSNLKYSLHILIYQPYEKCNTFYLWNVKHIFSFVSYHLHWSSSFNQFNSQW